MHPPVGIPSPGFQPLTRHWMSPRKSSLWAMSTRFQATAKRSSSRYAEASELPQAARGRGGGKSQGEGGNIGRVSVLLWGCPHLNSI